LVPSIEKRSKTSPAISIKFPIPGAEFIKDSTAIYMPMFLDSILNGLKILTSLIILIQATSAANGNREIVEAATMIKSRIFHPTRK
jgi:hypothetical protein